MMGSTKNNKRLILLIFGLFFVINIASNGGHFDSWDGIETFLVTESMVLHHSAKLYPDLPSIGKLHHDINATLALNNAYQHGVAYDPAHAKLEPTYTFRSLLSASIAVPFYYVATLFSVSPITVVAFFVNPLIMALVSVVIFCFSLEIYGSKKLAFILSLIFGVASFAWPYITSLVPQPLQALCLFVSAYFIYLSAKNNSYSDANFIKINNKKIYFAGLGGLFLGLSIFALPTSVVLIPGFILYAILSMRHDRKGMASFFVVLGIVLFSVGFVNYLRFGSFSNFGYGAEQSLSAHGGWKGLLGLLISPGKGFVFYFPLVLLLPVAMKYMYRINRSLLILCTYIIVVTWINYGTLNYNNFEPAAWTGQIGWGPRYLVPLLPFITILLGSLLAQLKGKLFYKISVVILCIVGFFVNLLGVLVWYQYGYAYGWERDELWRYDHDNKTKENSYHIMTWIPNYSPIALHLKVLMTDYMSKTKLYSHGDYKDIGLAPCSYDLYIFCKFGSAAILFPLVIISALGFLLIREITRGQHGAVQEKIIVQQHGAVQEKMIVQQHGNLKLLDRLNTYRKNNLKRSTLSKYGSLIISISISNLKLRYKNSFLGFTWTLLQPLLFLGVFYLVFSTFLANKVPYFPLYLLLGLIIWNTFTRATLTSMMSFINMRDMLSKVYFPREILPISANITSFIEILFDFCAFAVFVVIFHFVPTWTIIYLPLLLIMLFIVNLGISLALSVANVYFRDLQHIWEIVLQAGFFLAPIFLIIDFYPPYIRSLILLNPIALIIDLAHKVTLYNTAPSLYDLGYLTLVSFTALGIGYMIFKKFESRAIELL